MTSSALFLAIMGILSSFFPKEIIGYLNIDKNVITTLFFQILSALYLGYAILNGMAKGSTIGGIYNRPIAIGNLMHFGVGALALIKMVSQIEEHSEIIISLTIVYTIFTVGFGYVFFTLPKTLRNKQQ